MVAGDGPGGPVPRWKSLQPPDRVPMRRFLTVAFASSLPLFAQEAPAPKATTAAAKLSAKAFLPDDYRNIAFADLKALRDRGIWDELSVSVLKAAFEQMGKELGCPLDDLDRVTMVAAMVETERGPQPAQLSVLEGNKALPLPPSAVEKRIGGSGWEPERFGAFDVRRRAGDLLVQPSPEVLVTGFATWIEATLSGTSKGGLPCADLMSLLSGRADTLAFTVLDLEAPRMGEMIKARVFPGVQWPEGDAPRFVSVRLISSGEADDPHLGAEVVMRHQRAGAGQQVSIEAIQAMLKRWGEDPTKQGLRQLLLQAQVKTDRADVVLRGDLGRARLAVGTLATLVLPMFAGALPREAAPKVAPPAKK